MGHAHTHAATHALAVLAGATRTGTRIDTRNENMVSVIVRILATAHPRYINILVLVSVLVYTYARATTTARANDYHTCTRTPFQAVLIPVLHDVLRQYNISFSASSSRQLPVPVWIPILAPMYCTNVRCARGTAYLYLYEYL